MFASLLFAVAFEILPFYQQKPAEDYYAVRPLYATEGEVTDVLWPLFTYHKDWWRFCYVVNYQTRGNDEDSYQFSLVPFWFNGRDENGKSYAGLFPLAGEHPHIGMMYDFKFSFWPLCQSYKMPRGREWLTSYSVLFPIFHWRSDGAWAVWPLYGINYQRESTHQYALWPLVTWASYQEDRDTAGVGYSWMVFPFYAYVNRARESQHSFLPPFFSFASTQQSKRIRAPWPFFEYERKPSRERLSVWPFYEHVDMLDYYESRKEASVTRFGWKLIEIYDDEVRVFPFWASGRNHTRLWPFWEQEEDGDLTTGRFLALFPIRWIPAVDRNWSKFWTFYENTSSPLYTDHSLFWGLIRWRTMK